MDYPFRLEAGTPNTVGLAGLEAALLIEPDEGLLGHEQACRRALWQEIDGDERFTTLGSFEVVSPDRTTGTLCFNIEGWNPVDAAAALDSGFGIAVRAGLHCAPEAHRRFGSLPDGAIRVSFGTGNTEQETEYLLEALRQVAGAI
jgi:selenocysteine lyase/cysteine desulfurase